MAPMASRITDTQENGFILAPRFFKRFLAPGIPVYRIELMLQEVRRFFPGQAVGMRMRRGSGVGVHNIDFIIAIA